MAGKKTQQVSHIIDTFFLPNQQWWHAKMEAQSEYVHTAHTFFARLAPICVLSRCLLTKILHRSSLGSLLGVRCWLGPTT